MDLILFIYFHIYIGMTKEQSFRKMIKFVDCRVLKNVCYVGLEFVISYFDLNLPVIRLQFNTQFSRVLCYCIKILSLCIEKRLRG